MTSVYEQQLDLCERHQQERELSILRLRDMRHNMKNNLVSILAYAENGDNEKIIRFVNEIMEEGGIKTSTVTKKVVLDQTAPVIQSVTISPNPVNAGATYTISVEVTD